MAIITKQALIDSLTQSAANLNRVRQSAEQLKDARASVEPDVIQRDSPLAQGLQATVVKS